MVVAGQCVETLMSSRSCRGLQPSTKELFHALRAIHCLFLHFLSLLGQYFNSVLTLMKRRKNIQIKTNKQNKYKNHKFLSLKKSTAKKGPFPKIEEEKCHHFSFAIWKYVL